MADQHHVEPIAGIIVAGGQSRRMGEDKRRLKLWGAAGPTLLEHTVAVVARLCAQVIVVLNDPEAWPQLRAPAVDQLVRDVFPRGGSLGGIYSGLSVAHYDHALVVAADMPLLSETLLRWMVAQPRNFDVLVPRVNEGGKARNKLGVESLHAIYSQACLGPMERQLVAGNPQVIGFYDEVRVRLIEPATIARLDPQGQAFRNVNTPEELELVRNVLQGAQERDASETTGA
ncbi:MAG: molybdenum cofactor guanylyltransferase [Chloroflexota bacterium]|nr:molybdenum cofactor guanylyltransferase [Chloroflexota bacterium]PLS79336.1 MAG: molybdenum cofactor guanylyltransferase [Chloroflexota bacterium]